MMRVRENLMGGGFKSPPEEVMQMMKLVFFLNHFLLTIQKRYSSPKQISFQNIQCTLDNLSDGLDVGSAWIAGSEFLTGGTGGQLRSRQCLKVRLLGLISICQGGGLKGIHYSLRYKDRKGVFEYNDGGCHGTLFIRSRFVLVLNLF